MSDNEKIISLLERIARAVESMAEKKARAKTTKAAAGRSDSEAGERSSVYEFIRAWNKFRGDRLPPAIMPEPRSSRWVRILECLSIDGDMSHWAQAVEALSMSSWHSGNNERSWRATIDFLIQPNQRAKWLEEGAFRRSRPVEKKQAVVFCSSCDSPAVVGPGTRAPDVSKIPQCASCAG